MRGLLFVDDEEGVRRALARALKRESYELFLAAGAEEGLEIFHRHMGKIAIVISDQRMPGMNGLDFLVHVSQSKPEITRILLTGYATLESAIQATNDGIDGFLTKPFDNNSLRRQIHEIFIRRHLRQFVPSQFYDQLQKSPAALQPTLHEVTVLFCDIRNFTRMSQNVAPQRLVAFLNDDFFSPMGEIAYQYGGTVDKHIGDSLMVLFGSPVAAHDDAQRAVAAALAMQQKACEINARLSTQNGMRLQVGIGIAGGQVFSGVMGSLRRKEFTSIGMAVNIAARLQAEAAAGEIVATRNTFDHLDPATLHARIDGQASVRVKGIDEAIAVCRIKLA